ncbi:hypothetical protein BFW38_11085 [Terasakiispira papahanaumokuakeensis]|uniref:Chemotaxis protein n=1 Tax=Terasakiispira papahanaumokuakeensis TaxID=197479 RepID=A0A1E2VAG2_9GAMM|nr:methyl-accepting chemotaxis protein [Terasakiispira papahanaumokuakeensis]ODC04000.1 hypothetical protein BFW38_11085 [Terasakiispira papahanaumokuakeensis]
MGKALFGPAMALMNRLHYVTKFSLVSLLFLLPLVVFSTLILKTLWADWQLIQHERQGLSRQQDVLMLIQQAEHYRDLAALSNGRGEVELAQQQAAAWQRWQTSWQAFMTLAKTQFPGIETGPQFEQVQALVETMNTSPGRLGNHDLAMSHYQPLVTAVEELLENLRQRSELIRDSRLPVQWLQGVLLQEIPASLHAVSQVRSYGAYSFLLGYMDSSSSQVLDEGYERLQHQQAQLVQVQSVMQLRFPELSDQLAPRFEAASAALAAFQTALDEQLLAAMSLDQPWSAFYQQGDPAQAELMALAKALIEAADRQLADAESAQQQRIVWMVAGLAAILLLIAYLYTGFYLSMHHNIQVLLKSVQTLARGDLTQVPQRHTRDEMGALTDAFAAMAEHMRRLVQTVAETASEVDQHAHQVATSAQQAQQAHDVQTHETDQVATSMNQMSASATEVAQHASSAAETAQSVRDQVEAGHQQMQRVQSWMQQLANTLSQAGDAGTQLVQQSSRVNEMLNVIREIADQTNLLALNAAIEAARAGESGRGFAVVADEVRALASRTQASTQDIAEVIDQLYRGIDGVVEHLSSSQQRAVSTAEQAEQMGALLQEVTDGMAMILGMGQQMATAAHQQSSVADEIDGNLMRIREGSDHSRQVAQSTADISAQLIRSTDHLQQAVQAFRLY